MGNNTLFPNQLEIPLLAEKEKEEKKEKGSRRRNCYASCWVLLLAHSMNEETRVDAPLSCRVPARPERGLRMRTRMQPFSTARPSATVHPSGKDNNAGPAAPKEQKRTKMHGERKEQLGAPVLRHHCIVDVT